MSKWAILIAWIRCIKGYCPECQSNAPALDRCPVCAAYRSAQGGFPPHIIRASWMASWLRFHGVKD